MERFPTLRQNIRGPFPSNSLNNTESIKECTSLVTYRSTTMMKMSFVCTELTQVQNYWNLKRKAGKVLSKLWGTDKTSIPPTSGKTLYSFLTLSLSSSHPGQSWDTVSCCTPRDPRKQREQGHFPLTVPRSDPQTWAVLVANVQWTNEFTRSAKQLSINFNHMSFLHPNN